MRQPTHTTRQLQVAGLEGTEFKLADRPVRLVIFVHGFRGEPTTSWGDFRAVREIKWWAESDILFVGYASQTLDPTGVANTLRLLIERVYPHLPEEYLSAGGVYFRDPNRAPYSELILVGHSLGGLIVRRVAVDMVRSWERTGNELPPLLASGRMCLFSPATAGFDPTGSLGTLQSLLGRRVYEIVLRNPPALRDLRPNSTVLESCRRLTERAASRYEKLRVLFPQIVWANPDRVVVASDYDSDLLSHSQVAVTHRTVCKGHSGYMLPWEVIESGSLPSVV